MNKKYLLKVLVPVIDKNVNVLEILEARLKFLTKNGIISKKIDFSLSIIDKPSTSYYVDKDVESLI